MHKCINALNYKHFGGNNARLQMPVTNVRKHIYAINDTSTLHSLCVKFLLLLIPFSMQKYNLKTYINSHSVNCKVFILQQIFLF